MSGAGRDGEKRGAAGGVPTGPEGCRTGQGDRGRRRSTAAGPAGRAHIKEDDLRFAVRMMSRTGTPNTEPGKGGKKGEGRRRGRGGGFVYGVRGNRWEAKRKREREREANT